MNANDPVYAQAVMDRADTEEQEANADADADAARAQGKKRKTAQQRAAFAEGLRLGQAEADMAREDMRQAGFIVLGAGLFCGALVALALRALL